MRNPAAIVFDWDNTLVDSWGPIHLALARTFDAMGLTPWTLEETKTKSHLSLRDAFPALFGDRWLDARAIYYESFEAIHLDHLKPLPGAEAMLEAAGEGRVLTVVSNKTGRLLRPEIEALGWARFFRKIVGAGDASRDKPDRAPVDMALDGTGFTAGPDVWLVGDTEVDIECARNAGCVPVLMEGGGGLAVDPASLGATYRFHDRDVLRRTLIDAAMACKIAVP